MKSNAFKLPGLRTLPKFQQGYRAVVIGANGGIGSALLDAIRDDRRCSEAIGLSRSSSPAVDLENEHSIAAASEAVRNADPVHLLINAAGFLHGGDITPEKSLREIDPATVARVFAVNATGALLVMKYFAPLLPKKGASAMVSLVARVGSITDNRLGGWYSYRASKAALAMFIKTAAIELSRTRPDAICLGMHPGTVDTRLSAPFGGSEKGVPPAQAAAKMLQAVEQADSSAHGRQIAYDGSIIEY